jgi:hypothetical protein
VLVRAGQAYRWERISTETRHQRDPSLAIPTEVHALLTEGFLAPHRGVRQARGVYYYFGHLLAATAADQRNPKTQLRAWTKQDGLVAFDDKWPIGPNADFDRDRGRILVASTSDEDRKIPALFEIDWNTRRRRELLVIDRPGEMSLSSPFYLRDDGIAVRSQNRVRVLARDGDRLTVTNLALDVGDIIYLGARGRLIVTPTAIWNVDTTRIEQVAEFPEVLATCVQSFDGRVLRYTRDGCDELVGPDLGAR